MQQHADGSAQMLACIPAARVRVCAACAIGQANMHKLQVLPTCGWAQDLVSVRGNVLWHIWQDIIHAEVPGY